MKKTIVLSDQHCGHRAGLTPPDYQWKGRWGEVQKELWDEHSELAVRIGPADVILLPGDLLDGKGEASGGTEIVRMSRTEQAEMAVKCVEPWMHEDTQVVAAYGTSYHSGRSEDFEKIAVERLGGQVHSEPFIDVGGVVFGMKHFIGRSSIPHGRGTALLKDILWNEMWAIRDGQPFADVIIRGHVHHFFETTMIGAGGKLIQGIIAPALQAAQTKYGGRIMSSTVDWGVVEYNVEGGEYQWRAHIKPLKANRSKLIKIQ